MSSPFKMNPGRGPMKKTGRGIPKSLCSPAQQRIRIDAVSGKPVPKGAKFERSTYSFSDDGTMTQTTPYSTPGTPGGIDLGPNFKPTKEQTRIANKRKAEAGTKGTVERIVKPMKPVGIKPVKSNSEISGEIIQKTFKPKSDEEIQKNKSYIEKQNKRNRKNLRKMKRAKFWGNISSALTPNGRSGFKPGCFTD